MTYLAGPEATGNRDRTLSTAVAVLATLQNPIGTADPESPEKTFFPCLLNRLIDSETETSSLRKLLLSFEIRQVLRRMASASALELVTVKPWLLNSPSAVSTTVALN